MMAAVLNTHIIELTQFVNVRPYALSTAQSSPDLASGLINEPSILIKTMIPFALYGCG